MSRQLFWVVGAIGVSINALSLVKLVNHFSKIGFSGIPKYIIDSYTAFISELQYWLIEFPFKIEVPDQAVHLFIVWMLFAGSNYRFLTFKGIGAPEGIGTRLYIGLGDVGRGQKPAKSKKMVIFLDLMLSLTGPVFFLLVVTMWVCNKPGPSGGGGLRDILMIGNRLYSRRISRTYMLILLLSPLLAGMFLAWNAAGNLG